MDEQKIATIKKSLQQKGTIGIVGYSALEVAKLNTEIIKQANLLGLNDDQQIPDILAIGISHQNEIYLKDSIKICRDYGCDIVAIFHKIKGTKLENEGLLGLDDHQNIEEFAKFLVEKSIAIQQPIRPNLVYGYEDNVEENLALDLKFRQEKVSQEGYSILKKYGDKCVYVLGGAGPAASSDQVEKLAMKGVFFIHSSVNCAPGKHKFEIGVGPSYLQHYRNDLYFCQELNKSGIGAIIIPCNTAHRRIKEFCPEELQEKIVDIRSFLKERTKVEKDFILLGTDTTIGINPDVIGTYEQYRKEYVDNCNEFIIPNVEQQKSIMSAIFDVKAGRMNEAKAKILNVIETLRILKPNSPVILGCTELPLPFSKLELVDLNLINPVQDMVNIVNRFLLEKIELTLKDSSYAGLSEDEDDLAMWNPEGFSEAEVELPNTSPYTTKKVAHPLFKSSQDNQHL